ncbi:hypothetical protein BGZ76_001408 [Entomortierella beljakovae]|nr:hypothetical protein BGZ76_001408 [Entomortierella beljakovae]
MLGYKIPENLKFWELLSNQPNLKYINISFQQVPSNEVHAFWSTLCLLDAAKLDGLILSNNVMDHSTTPIKLKRLILGIVGNPLLHMEVIEKFTGLESLYWSASWFQAKDLINRFINFNWPNLHRIELDFVSFNNVELQQILSTTPRLTALSVDSAKWGFESFNALSCHFETLEKLGARHSKSFTSMMVNTVMCSCPNLKVLKAWKIDGLDIIHNNQMESAGRGNREWVCNQLESVDLRFDLVGLATQIPILEMMARMTKLKILDMTGNLGDKDYVLTISLSLKDGLDVLKPLKYLEHVFITGNSHSMTEDDMEWILQNWKHLTLFEGRFHRDPKRFEELRQMYNMRKSKD